MQLETSTVASLPPAVTGTRWRRAARAAGAEATHTTEGTQNGGSSSSTSRAVNPAERCPICLDSITVDAGMPCGHSVCAVCLGEYLESLVDQGRVGAADLCCPLPECRRPLTDLLVASIVKSRAGGERLYERLLDFQARRFVPEAAEGEKLVTCPTPECGKVLVSVDLVAQCGEALCPLCRCSFCAGCCQQAHPGTSCEAAEIERMDPELRRLIARETWKRCPCCRNLCERESGCNFMTCPSEECQGKTHFCYLCGELLTAADHSAHYEGFEGAVGRMGPFGSVCANRREVDLSLPTRPPPPRLSVVVGDEEGSLALRITWGPHRSEPPTIYYRVRLEVPGSPEVKHINAQAGEPFHDVKRGLPKYRRYQAVITPVNVNGAGPASEPSEVVHFHPRELAPPTPAVSVAPKPKRWGAR